MFSDMKLVKINKSRCCHGGPKSRVAAACGLLLLLPLLAGAQDPPLYQPDLLVRLGSEGDAAYLGAGVFEASAQLQSKSQAAFPGLPAAFRVKLTNAGNQSDKFLVRGTASGASFTVSYGDGAGGVALSGGFTTADLLPGESLSFSVQVTPAALPLGADYRVTIDASSLQGAAAGQVKVDQVKMETISCSSSAAVTLSAPPDSFGPPGSVVNYPYTVTNVGNTPDSFALSVQSPAGWPGALYADDGAGGGVAGDAVRQAGESVSSATTGVLVPGASYHFFLAQTVPAGSADGTHADTRVSAAGVGASGVDQVTTSASAATISTAESVRNLTEGGAFAPNANALPGDTLEYRMAVTNSGSLPATFVGISSAVPANTTALPGSLWIGTVASGEGSACTAALCGFVRLTGGSIVAHLGSGASEAAGGSLLPGTTLYVYFRAQVE
jgi:uncharacterized repeat protein (TIGR01451 family)